MDLNGKPQEGFAFKIKKPDGGTESGKLDKEGRGAAMSATPGKFTVIFPDLDGADCDGDGAEPSPPESARSEASRYTVQQGDRLPTIASDHGFARWQTIWDFVGKKALKDLRGNAHILLPKDKVSIPTKLPRKAIVPGGGAEYVVQSKAEALLVRFTSAASIEDCPVTFEAQPDTGPEVTGTLKPDGTMEIGIPEDTRLVVVRLFMGADEGPFETYRLRIGHLDPLDEISGVQDRLANLGYYSGPSNGKLDEATQQAISAFRAEVLGDDRCEIDEAFKEALGEAHST